jgi:PleD family two-component response regulator
MSKLVPPNKLNNKTQRYRILVADDPKSLLLIADALSEHDVVKVTTIREAERMIVEDGIDLFIIGTNFDDARSIELIKFIRSNEVHCDTPIIVLQIPNTAHGAIVKKVFEIMPRSTLDITEYVDLVGNPDASAKIREIVYSCMSSRKQQV